MRYLNYGRNQIFELKKLQTVQLKEKKKLFLKWFYKNTRVKTTVKTGPVLASKVALAIDVFLTPKKKHAKWKPKNTPANATVPRDSFFNGFGLIKILYIQRTALAIIILQKAIVIAGTEGSALMIKRWSLQKTRLRLK